MAQMVQMVCQGSARQRQVWHEPGGGGARPQAQAASPTDPCDPRRWPAAAPSQTQGQTWESMHGSVQGRCDQAHRLNKVGRQCCRQQRNDTLGQTMRSAAVR